MEYINTTPAGPVADTGAPMFTPATVFSETDRVVGVVSVNTGASVVSSVTVMVTLIVLESGGSSLSSTLTITSYSVLVSKSSAALVCN